MPSYRSVRKMTVRVVVVDDSATMRSLISTTLRSDPEIEVVGEAADPYEAREVIKKTSPDVITLDVEMPNMSGISFLDKIMKLRPTPVIMVSTLTQRGADASLAALEIGAFDCIQKPSSSLPGAFDTLIQKVKDAAQAGCKPRRLSIVKETNKIHDYKPDGSIVAIGSSTGGVEALIEILSGFPKNCPPTIISQHMPANFIKSFVLRLRKLCQPNIYEAQSGQNLEAGNVYFSPGDQHMEIYGESNYTIKLNQLEKVNGHRPSVDVMFESVAKYAGSKAVGVILTGLGADGARGLLSMRRVGAQTIGQDEDSCVVYGMPRVAFEIGAVLQQSPLDQISEKILKLTNRRKMVD